MARLGDFNAKEYSRKVWIAASILLLLLALVWLFAVTFNVILLVLAASLIALFFRGLSDLLSRKLNISSRVSLPVAVISTILILALFFWFIGARVETQVSELTETLPEAVDTFKQNLKGTPLGEKIYERIGSERQTNKMSELVQSFFTSSFGIIGDMYVIVFLGIFFTTGAKTYIKGFLSLIPAKGRKKGDEILREVGTTLQKWLKGKLFAMLVVTILTAIGLYFLGMPMALSLAIIAGILNFIPNFGPILAMIPAVLIALMQNTTMALMVAGLYIVIQVVESNFITPQIQKKLVDIPPALIILAQLIMGVVTGSWGLVLATPVVLIVMIILKKLYIKPTET